jgi:hypothetical protein
VGRAAGCATDGAAAITDSANWTSSSDAASGAAELRRKRSKNDVFFASPGLFSDEGESMEVLILRLVNSSVSYHLPRKKCVKLTD